MITRFAPSPTGPLHLGHAYSALLAHDMARAAGGRFLLRIEDTDLARCTPAWEAQITSDLAWLGLTWEGPMRRQSEHLADYAAALASLAARGLVYPCSCSRSDIRAALSAPQEGDASAPYPGTCRGRPISTRRPGDAMRLDMAAAIRAAGPELRFTETGPAHAGIIAVTPEALLAQGDIVLGRKDGAAAYVLAAVHDDALQAVTDVIRGEDLFAFTAPQILLQRLFGDPSPSYHHHPLIRDAQGKRLAKRDDARSIAQYRNEGIPPQEVRRMVGLAL